MRPDTPSPRRRPERLDAFAAEGLRTGLLRDAGLKLVETQMFTWTMEFESFDAVWELISGPRVFERQLATLDAPAREAMRHPRSLPSAEISGRAKKGLAKRRPRTYFTACPISHVPVAACRLVGIRTRGRTAARDRKGRCQRGGNLSAAVPVLAPDPNTTTGSRRRNRRTPLSTGDAA